MQELFHLYDLSIYTDVNNKTNNDYNESIKDGVHTLTKSAIDHANGCSPRQQQFIHSINMPDADNILIICGILDNISNNYIVKLKAYDKNAKQLDNKININELSMLSNEDDIEWWASISCTCDEENILPSQTYNQLRIQLQNEKHLINQLGNKYNAEDMVGLQSSYGKFIAGDIMSAFWPNMRYNKLIYKNRLQVHYPSLPDGDYKRFATYGQNYCIAPAEIMDETKITDTNAITIDSPLIYVSLEHGKPMINGDPIPNYDKYATQISIKDDFKNIQNEQTLHKDINIDTSVVKQKTQDNIFEK